MRLLNALVGTTIAACSEASRFGAWIVQPAPASARVFTQPAGMRCIAFVMAMVMALYFDGSPLYAGIQAPRGPVPPPRVAPARAAPRAQVDNIRMDELLVEARSLAVEARAGTDIAQRLRKLKARLDGEHAKVEKHLADVAAVLAKHAASQELLARHTQTAESYRARQGTLAQRMDALLAAQGTPALARLKAEETLAFLKANVREACPSRIDARNLPFRSLRSETPILPGSTPTQGAGNERGGGGGQEAAQLDAPTSDDLQETIEVQLTPEIRALAEELGRSPLKIYQWVRSNIEHVPTWGSIQGAQLCLQTRHGNAFDTASLLIALLRAAGVPARYQMGTIEVPAAQFMNWAGGFTNLDAAASFFASAGTPSVVRRADATGQATSVRLDHVWVRAFIDYIPSRGAARCAEGGEGDTWVELDASYKLYEYANPLDLEAAVPSGIDAFVKDLEAKAVVDPVTGAVSGIDTDAIDTWVRRTIEERKSFLLAQPPETTVRNVVGGRHVSLPELPFLSIVPPNSVLQRTASFPSVPSSLRHSFSIELGASPGSGELLTWSASLPELAGKDVLLLYRPASAAEEKLVGDLLAAGAALPSSIQMTPQLVVGDQIVSGPAIALGSRVHLRYAFESPTVSTPPVLNAMDAGEATAIGIDLQGVPAGRLDGLRAKTEALKTAFEGQNPQVLGADFARVLLSGAVVSWFAMVDGMTELSSHQAGIVTVRYPSAGLFSLKLRISSAFGVPISADPQGLGMDIDRDVVVSEALNGNRETVAALGFVLGALGSSMEAQVPTLLFSSPETPVRSVSTMDALRLANDAGIPVHRIDGTNIAAALPHLAYDAQEIDEVRAAVASGLEVQIPERPVEWEGQDLIAMVIRDPVSGSGSYLIGGDEGAVMLLSVLLLAALTIILFLEVAAVGGMTVLVSEFLLACGYGFNLAGILSVTIYGLGGGSNARLHNLTPCELTHILVVPLAPLFGLFIGPSLPLILQACP